MNVKRVLYEKVIVPTVMYGWEVLGMKVTERQKLKVLVMKSLSSMAGVSRLERVTNEVVRVKTGVRNDSAARMDINVLGWFGHVEGMDRDCLLKNVMNARVVGRSTKGRSRFRWMNRVKKSIGDRRIDVREVRERARNRTE
ncbi:uncharacterized protein [Palaemon carinicauda]|uniref:uncharacterized protein n=1 Tax=Palaemon carinicauda TaxID=392227 RepID=UPI0035B5B7FF